MGGSGVAAAAAAPFLGLWLDAPESTLLQRVAQRRSDASDADAAIVREQIARGAGLVTWHTPDATAATPDMLSTTRTLLRKQFPESLNAATDRS